MANYNQFHEIRTRFEVLRLYPFALISASRVETSISFFFNDFLAVLPMDFSIFLSFLRRLNSSMNTTILKTKLHRAFVIRSELNYKDSCAIDRRLLDTASILEYEQIQIYNINNGERFTTYAIPSEEGPRIISVNGAAAHKAEPGHRIFIFSYVMLNQQELFSYQPILIYLYDKNNITL